jgi:hypothetical protein
MKAKTMAGLLAATAGIAAGAYAAYAATNWWRYGRPPRPVDGERDDLLDRFIPEYDIVERHRAYVNAAARFTLQAAKEQDLMNVAAVRAIFKARELVMGATPDEHAHPRGLLANVRSLGWGVLAELPDREIIVGAITKPWEANVTFQAMPADDFRSFAEPGFVKIAWTLRADPLPNGASIFRTETRAVATDAESRARFRNYWALASPGIALIRRLSLGPLSRDAEARARQAQAAEPQLAAY